MDNSSWTPISLICVEYPKGDSFGHLLAYISLLPFAIIVSFVTLCSYNRDLPTIYFFLGQMINEAMNIVLKQIFKHQRPNNPHQLVRSANKYGMPSQHCQFMSFFTTYCCLYLTMNAIQKTPLTKVTLISLLLSSLVAVIYSRIYLLYHFSTQCVAGTLIGCVWGYVWFKVVFNLFAPYFDSVASWKISRTLGIQTWNHISSKRKKTY